MVVVVMAKEVAMEHPHLHTVPPQLGVVTLKPLVAMMPMLSMPKHHLLMVRVHPQHLRVAMEVPHPLLEVGIEEAMVEGVQVVSAMDLAEEVVEDMTVDPEVVQVVVITKPRLAWVAVVVVMARTLSFKRTPFSCPVCPATPARWTFRIISAQLES
uniref:Uncharacterized protein n=1 Tax=Cacopsylla melanoneura TaxID=428564 RepID=A0A8D8UUJ1_9HEMI